MARATILAEALFNWEAFRKRAAAPAIRLVDDQFPSWQPSVGSLVPLGRVSSLVPLGKLGRLYTLAFARYLIAFSIGVAVAFTWQSYGNATRGRRGRRSNRSSRRTPHFSTGLQPRSQSHRTTLRKTQIVLTQNEGAHC